MIGFQTETRDMAFKAVPLIHIRRSGRDVVENPCQTLLIGSSPPLELNEEPRMTPIKVPTLVSGLFCFMVVLLPLVGSVNPYILSETNAQPTGFI